MENFKFTNQANASQAASVVCVLRQPRLWIPSTIDYPDYDDWLLRTEADLVSGSKRAMAAYHGRRAVGAIVYREHPQDSSTLQIKNISISPESSGRYVASFLLRNVEIEGSQRDFPNTDSLVVDTKLRNVEMIEFLLRHGYQTEAVTDIYGLGAGMDAVLSKKLNQQGNIR